MSNIQQVAFYLILPDKNGISKTNANFPYLFFFYLLILIILLVCFDRIFGGVDLFWFVVLFIKLLDEKWDNKIFIFYICAYEVKLFESYLKSDVTKLLIWWFLENVQILISYEYIFIRTRKNCWRSPLVLIFSIFISSYLWFEIMILEISISSSIILTPSFFTIIIPNTLNQKLVIKIIINRWTL